MAAGWTESCAGGYPGGLGTIVGGRGARLDLASGGSLIDLAGGGLGYADPRVCGPVAEQLRHLPLSTRSFLSRPLATVAVRLAGFSPPGLEVCYLCNSGAEALDGALKLARGRHPDRLEVVLAVAPAGHRGHAAQVPRIDPASPVAHSLGRVPVVCRPVPFGDADLLARAVTGRTCAVVLEPVFCAAGVTVPPAGYLAAARAACDRTGAVLIADETVTGLGRTGHWFAMGREDARADVVVLGSTLGGGVLPVGAYVTTRRINDRVYGRRTPVLHGTTTGGNPVACVAALATLSVIEEDDVAAGARRFGAVIGAALRELGARFPEVAGGAVADGLLAAVAIPDTALASAVQRETLRRGALVLRQGPPAGPSWLAIRPPLLIGSDELQRGLDALAGAVGAVAGSLSGGAAAGRAGGPVAGVAAGRATGPADPLGRVRSAA
jgi:acetylornithine/succinyldiaminopimelate/putrescine aminotransferase